VSAGVALVSRWIGPHRSFGWRVAAGPLIPGTGGGRRVSGSIRSNPRPPTGSRSSVDPEKQGDLTGGQQPLDFVHDHHTFCPDSCVRAWSDSSRARQSPRALGGPEPRRPAVVTRRVDVGEHETDLLAGSRSRWELGVEDDLPASRPVGGGAGPSRLLIQPRHATPTFPTSQSRHPGPAGSTPGDVLSGGDPWTLTPAAQVLGCTCGVGGGGRSFVDQVGATCRSGMFRFCEPVRSTSNAASCRQCRMPIPMDCRSPTGTTARCAGGRSRLASS
jgi:hypothetical protein